MNQIIDKTEEENCLTRHGSRVHCTKCHYKTSPQLLMSGFLIKSPRNNKCNFLNKWRNRYFILRRDNTIEYYTSYKNKKPIAVINLEDVQRVDVGMGSHKHQHIFNFVLPQRTYFFSAGSAEIMWAWVEQIKQINSKIEVTEYETELASGKAVSPGDKLLEYYIKEPVQASEG